LGDILAGEKKERQVAESDTNKKKRFDRYAPLSYFRNSGQNGISTFFKAGFEDLISDFLTAIDSKNQINRQNVYLIGWIRDDVLKTGFVSPNADDEGMTLLSLEIPVRETP
jgi:hypothetical protein